jgi:hypothetical protein
LLGTPSVKSVHGYYPFAQEDGGRLAPVAVELVDRLVILVAVRRFSSMGATDSRSLRSECYVRMQHFVHALIYLLCSLSTFLGGCAPCGENSRNVFSAILHGPLGYYLRDALHKGNADACMPSCSSGLGM